MATTEFNKYKNDPELNAELLPDGSLVFEDGGGYMVIGPNFVSVADSEDFAYGDDREDAIENYLTLVPAEERTQDPPALMPGEPLLEV
jgi:hypothetical protein